MSEVIQPHKPGQSVGYGSSSLDMETMQEACRIIQDSLAGRPASLLGAGWGGSLNNMHLETLLQDTKPHPPCLWTGLPPPAHYAYNHKQKVWSVHAFSFPLAWIPAWGERENMFHSHITKIRPLIQPVFPYWSRLFQVPERGPSQAYQPTIEKN